VRRALLSHFPRTAPRAVVARRVLLLNHERRIIKSKPQSHTGDTSTPNAGSDRRRLPQVARRSAAQKPALLLATSPWTCRQQLTVRAPAGLTWRCNWNGQAAPYIIHGGLARTDREHFRRQKAARLTVMFVMNRRSLMHEGLSCRKCGRKHVRCV